MFYYIMCIIGILFSMTGCIEDGISTSPAHQPRMEIDTLALGTVFTGEATPTACFKVYNPYDKIINIDRIALRSTDSDAAWRLNVDGISSEEFRNVEIRPNDSIFVFVDVTLPDLRGVEPREYVDFIDFTTLGVTESVTLSVSGLDAERLDKVVITEDTEFTSRRPYIIYDSLVVAPGVTLTLGPGTRLHFHSDASLDVNGTLLSLGTPELPVEMIGDRMGKVVGRVDYEIMSGQWGGVYFAPTSTGNKMEYTSIRNSTWGAALDSVPYTDTTPSLRMLNCQLRNSKGYIVESHHSSIEAVGCELADASAGILYLRGGRALISNSTIANYYLFTAVGPAVQFAHAWSDEDGDSDAGRELPLLGAEFHNTIIYGNGSDLSRGDLTGSNIYLRNCMLKSEGTNDDNFIDCIWGEDPLYFTNRPAYHFDYRLKAESPAIGAANPELIPAELTIDRYGLPRTDNTLGAYSFDPTVEEVDF